MYLNLVLDFVPETVYRVIRHHSKNKQTMPTLYTKVRRGGGEGEVACEEHGGGRRGGRVACEGVGKGRGRENKVGEEEGREEKRGREEGREEKSRSEGEGEEKRGRCF